MYNPMGSGSSGSDSNRVGKPRNCCCGAEFCTRILSWIMIVLGIVALIFRIIGLRNYLALTRETHYTGDLSIFSMHGIKITYHPSDIVTKGQSEEITATVEPDLIYLSIYCVNIVVVVLGIIMYTILLIGSYKRILKLLQVFIIYEVISLVAEIIRTVLIMHYVHLDAHTYGVVLQCVVIYMIGISSIIAVYWHKKEMEAAEKSISSYVLREHWKAPI